MYKFKRTLNIDDFSGATVDILVGDNNQLQIRVTDLIGDSWLDCLEALAQAEKAEREGAVRDRNKEVYTCLVKLVTHLDGVVSGLWEYLERARDDFRSQRPEKRKKRHGPHLAQRIEFLRAYVLATAGVTLPTLDLDFKEVRNLLVHPVGRGGASKSLSQGDTFDLTLEDLKVAVSMVDQWLGALTSVFEYPAARGAWRLEGSGGQKRLRRARRWGRTFRAVPAAGEGTPASRSFSPQPTGEIEP